MRRDHIVRVALLAVMLSGLTGCFEHTMTVTLREDGSGTVDTTLITDLPVSLLLERNPELKARILTRWPASADRVTCVELHRGELEGVSIQGPIDSVAALQNAWPLSVRLLDPTNHLFRVQLLAPPSRSIRPAHLAPSEHRIPTGLFEMMSQTLFTNAFSHVAPVSVKGALHGLKLDYALELPGQIRETNGQRSGNTVRWHYDLDREHLVDLQQALPGLPDGFPYVEVQVPAWPTNAFPPVMEEPREAPPWPAAHVIMPKGATGSSLDVHVAATTLTRHSEPMKSGDNQDRLSIQLLFIYRDPGRKPLKLHVRDAAAKPNDAVGGPSVERSWFPGAWHRQTDGSWSATCDLTFPLIRPTRSQITVDDLSLTARVTTASTQAPWALTIDTIGYYIVAWDGNTAPHLEPDPLKAGTATMTNQAFIRGADAATHALLRLRWDASAWRREEKSSLRPERYAHPINRGTPVTLLLARDEVRGENYTISFPTLVLP